MFATKRDARLFITGYWDPELPKHIDPRVTPKGNMINKMVSLNWSGERLKVIDTKSLTNRWNGEYLCDNDGEVLFTCFVMAPNKQDHICMWYMNYTYKGNQKSWPENDWYENYHTSYVVPIEIIGINNKQL